MEAEEKDLCKKCKHYWVDFRVNPDKIYVPLCEIADEKISYKALDDIVPYPCLECPFNSFEAK